MKIGIIGYGAIGQLLAEAIRDGRAGDVSLVAVKDIYDGPPFPQTEDGLPHYSTSIETFLAQDIDVVVETASQSVLKEYAASVVRSGKDLIVMSVGAFADVGFLEKLTDLARRHNCQVLLPSGAIGGLDAISAAGLDEIREVTLTTTKPVRALQGVKSTIEPDLDLNTITAPTLLYEGPAEQAVRRHPKNVNVAAALCLAGIGFKETTVRIIADPHASRNIHKIEAKGKFGELSLGFVLYPAPSNPKTSYLAALSVIRTVKNLTGSVKFGNLILRH